MAINFKEIAQKELTLSPLVAGKTQIKTDDLIGQEVTITEFDFATITDKGVEKTYPVMLLKEYPERYYNGGALLLKLAIAWASACDGDVEAASQELKNEGGVKVRFRSTRTKAGNNLTSVDVL